MINMGISSEYENLRFTNIQGESVFDGIIRDNVDVVRYHREAMMHLGDGNMQIDLSLVCEHHTTCISEFRSNIGNKQGRKKRSKNRALGHSS